MKNTLRFIPALGLLLILGSCTVYKTSVPQAGVQARLNMEMTDLQYIKDASGTAVQSYFLGLPIGGTKYKRGMVTNCPGNLQELSGLHERGVNSAIYNALESTPDADFVLPVSMRIVSNKMFLGREDSIIVRVKTFKINTRTP